MYPSQSDIKLENAESNTQVKLKKVFDKAQLKLNISNLDLGYKKLKIKKINKGMRYK